MTVGVSSHYSADSTRWKAQHVSTRLYSEAPRNGSAVGSAAASAGAGVRGMGMIGMSPMQLASTLKTATAAGFVEPKPKPKLAGVATVNLKLRTLYSQTSSENLELETLRPNPTA